MDDLLKIAASLLAAIIYYLYSSSKNMNQQQTRRPGQIPRVDEPVQPPKPPVKVSFEEMLKEFEEKVKQQLPEPSPEETIQDRKSRNKKKSETTNAPVPFSYDDRYNTPQQLPQSRKTVAARPVAPAPKTAPEEERAAVTHPLTAFLADPQQIRNAFVLSEIFHRKW